jgi:hypothetical protein
MNDMNTWISLISTCIALVAVIVGPIVSWRIAKRQVVSPTRQQWINDLRSRIADLMSASHHFFVAWPGGDLPEGEEMEAKAHRKMLFLYREIELMLNPNEKDHQVLLELLQKISFNINLRESQITTDRSWTKQRPSLRRYSRPTGPGLRRGRRMTEQPHPAYFMMAAPS